MPKPEIECVVDARAEVGESPVWSVAERALWWVDIDGKRLHRHHPESGGNGAWDIGEEIGCIALRRAGGLICGLRRGYGLFDPASGRMERLHNPEPDRPDHRFNDGGCDGAGRFWAGTMRMAHAGKAGDGRLYRIEPDGTWHLALDGFWTVNGIAFSPDGRRMYASDSNADVRTIWSWDYDPAEGAMRSRRVFAGTRDLAGRPDGGAVDADGCYWMAGVGGWQLVRFTPDGKVDRIIDMPVEKPSKIAFGGPALDVMYVTSISQGTDGDNRQPQAGGLFAIRAGMTGLPPNLYAG